jgi:hypothetical protein
MTQTTILTHSAACGQCGAQLPAGTTVRGPYRNGAVYGTDCHARATKSPTRDKRRTRGRYYEPLGQKLSRYDPAGLYTADGRCIARVSCGHEDYPCCGC